MAVKKVRHGRGYSYEMTTNVDGKVIRRRFKSIKEANDAYARSDLRVSAGYRRGLDRPLVPDNGRSWARRVACTPGHP